MRTQRVKRKTKRKTKIERKTHRKKDARSRVKRSSKNKKTRTNKKKKINKSKQKKIRAGAGAGPDGKYKNIIKGLTGDIIKLKQKLEECESKSDKDLKTDDTSGSKLTTGKIDYKFMDRISASLKDYKSSPRGRRMDKEKQNVMEATTPPGTPPDSD